jgi:hypothetical protein
VISEGRGGSLSCTTLRKLNLSFRFVLIAKVSLVSLFLLAQVLGVHANSIRFFKLNFKLWFRWTTIRGPCLNDIKNEKSTEA